MESTFRTYTSAPNPITISGRKNRSRRALVGGSTVVGATFDILVESSSTGPSVFTVQFNNYVAVDLAPGDVLSARTTPGSPATPFSVSISTME